MSDFVEAFKDPEVFMNSPDAFELVQCAMHRHNPTWNELRAYVVQYILAITMWEREFGHELEFGYNEMLRGIPTPYHEPIAIAFQDILAVGIIDKEYFRDNELRIIRTPDKLQEAMDICGSWYNGIDGDNFLVPSSLDCVYADRSEYNQLAEELGGHDVLHKAILMDIRANAPTSYMVN